MTGHVDSTLLVLLILQERIIQTVSFPRQCSKRRQVATLMT